MSSGNFSDRHIFNILSAELSSQRYITVEPIEQSEHLSIPALFYWNQMKYGIYLDLGPLETLMLVWNSRYVLSLLKTKISVYRSGTHSSVFIYHTLNFFSILDYWLPSVRSLGVQQVLEVLCMLLTLLEGTSVWSYSTQRRGVVSRFQGFGGAMEYRPLHQPPSPKQKGQMVRESQPLPPVRTPTNLCLEACPLFAEEPSNGLTPCIPVFFVLNSQISFFTTPLLHFLPFCLRQFPVVRGFEWQHQALGWGRRGWRQSLVRGSVIHICCKASKGLGVVVLVGVQVWIAKKG